MTERTERSISVRQRPRLAVGLLAGAVGAALPGARRVAQARSSNVPAVAVAGVDALAPEVIPPDRGQTQIQAFVPETGHTISGTMLDYWRATGAASTFGNPISEPFASYDGYYSQAFENAILQFRPDFVWTDDPTVRLASLGSLALQSQQGGFGLDGRRTGGGGDRRDFAFQPVGPNSTSAQNALNSGGQYVEATGHTLTGDFLNWWMTHEGWFYFGNPLSQPFLDHGRKVQYFEGGMLVAEGGVTKPASLGLQMASYLAIDTTPVDGTGLPAFDESLFMTGPNPNGDFDMYAPGPKRIEVNITQQQAWAYQGDTLIMTTLVSTGIDPNKTEEGQFHVRYKQEKTDMKGFTDSTGEVIGLGDGSGNQNGTPYEVKDIPDVMYFDFDAEALHGAYWHNNFGHKMSHGCVNLPLDVAKFVFGWAPLGTQVWTHE